MEPGWDDDRRGDRAGVRGVCGRGGAVPGVRGGADQGGRQAGSEEYAELLLLALRQSVAAHKAAVDPEGKLLFVSKECFSNGCAATVDVSYPSIPLFLLYNTELVKGMMRPIFRYAAQEKWPFDFAPHDVGTYPILNGQVYGGGTDPRWQMPVEECGNMLVMAAAVSAVDGNADFAGEYRELLAKWAGYLLLSRGGSWKTAVYRRFRGASGPQL